MSLLFHNFIFTTVENQFGISRLFISIPPHPAPLPRGKREFPDEN
jgi:hypothetical protein